MNNNLKYAVILCFVLAFLIAYHQWSNWGTWFEVEDIHHETFIAILIAFALGIIFSEKIGEDSGFSSKKSRR